MSSVRLKLGRAVLACAVMASGCVTDRGEHGPTGQRGVPDGVHVICLQLYKRPNYRAILEGILDLEYISGLLAYVHWSDFEPEEGQYQWQILDTALAVAEARGKVVAFGLVPQVQSPSWVMERSRTYSFEHMHPSVGTVTSPVPWDPGYRQALARTVRALAARYDGHPALHYVVINGPSSLYGVETNFPVKSISEEASRILDYSHERFASGWRASIDLFTAAFRRTRLSLGLHHHLSLGPADLDTRMALIRGIRDYAIRRERDVNGKRLIVRLLGLATEHPGGFPGPYRASGDATTPYVSLTTDVRGQADIAYEVARIWRLANVGGRQQPLDAERFDRVLQLGVSHHANWIEVKDLDVWDVRGMAPYEPFAPALVAAHQRLSDRDARLPAESRPAPPVFAVYYTWYSTAAGPHGTWSSWGTDSASLLRPSGCNPDQVIFPPKIRDISSCAYPLAGIYDSDDPDIVRWHMRLAKAAGVDAFLVDWWGPAGWQSVPGLTHDAFVDTILPIAEQEDFKVCLFDETAQFVDDFGQVKQWAAEYLGRFKDSPAYLRINGEPVYVIYQVPFRPSLIPRQATELRDFVEARVGPIYWVFDKIATGPDPATGGFSSFVIPDEWLDLEWIDAFCGYGTFSVIRKHGYHELAPRFAYMSYLAHRHGHQVMLPAHPGHNNSKLTDTPWVIPRRDGQTLREYLHAAQDAQADFILLTSWNEWPETTVVEPAFTWPDPFLYLRILADWKGVDFTPIPPPER